jgi:trehalose 6-phosphate phosphatase
MKMQEGLLPYKAIILDLDGVITDTRSAHFQSWKKLFDNYFKDHGEDLSFSKEDYVQFVDGKTREEGIKSYLSAKGVELPQKEIDLLKEEKNQFYLESLEKNPPEVFSDSLESLKDWKTRGVPLAVVSSSENCRFILKKLHLDHFFETCVDGTEGKKLHLKGKPEPDYFLKASELLGISPSDCALVEDSLTGVIAGKKALFKTVYGMSRFGQTSRTELYASGADTVISSLRELETRRHAILNWDDFKDHVGDKEIALFLDFDGTISEIVPEPDKASIKPHAIPVLQELAKAFKVAVMSGRDRSDIKLRVKLENIFYAGCHGFDMSGPGCFQYKLDNIEKPLSDLENATLLAVDMLSEISGVIVEQKLFGTAIHYRMTTTIRDEEFVLNTVRRIAGNFPSLKIKEGKKVFELVPAIDWGKGKAVQKLIEILNLDTTHTIPVYFGDDETDEDAFLALHGRGIGIKVDKDLSSVTNADYLLNDPDEVIHFLKMILKEFGGEERKWRHQH